MAQSYTRQSTFSDGDTITASLFNNEYNQLVNAFSYSSSSSVTTGHRHDGTAGEGGNIHTIGDLDFLNKIVVDSTNNRWGVYVEVSGSAVEQIRIQDGAIVPVTDNDIDLGTSSLEFKNIYIDGTAKIDTLTVDENATVAGTLGVTGATTLSSTLGVTGATTLSSTLALTGAATLSSTLAVTGTSTLTGNVTASNDLSVGGNLTVTGNATIAGNLTFGDAATDTVSFSADVSSNLLPSADDTYDLGASGSEWRNLYIDGTANIDSLVADTADINAGTIDNTAIGGTTASSGAFTTLSASGATTLSTTLGVTGATTLSSTLAVTGATTLSSTLGVTGESTLASAKISDLTSGRVVLAGTSGAVEDSGNLTFDGTTLAVTGAATVSTNLTVSGNTTLGNAATDTVTVTADVASNLIPSADSTYSLGDSSNYWSAGYIDAVTTTGDVSVGGNLTVTGNATISGNLTFGDAATDTVSFSADVSSNVLPSADDTYDLGASGSEWKDLYVDGTAYIDAIDFNGTALTVTGTELNVMDGDTAATSTTLADADRVVVNDAGVMKQVALTDFETYFETALDTLSNVTTVGTIGSGVWQGTSIADAYIDNNLTISGGTVDNSVIGGTTPAAGTFTTLTANTSITGTLATAAQTNVTSVGTLSSLAVSGDLTVDTSTLKIDSTNNRVGILNATPDVTLDIGSATDAVHIPVGTTAQRPGTPAAGYFRYNTSLSQFEGYTDTWGAIGGGGTNTFTTDSFTGDGTTTAFVLSQATESENNLIVFIDGVFQTQDAYSIATSAGVTTLTMSAAPASGRKIVVYVVAAGVSGNNLNLDQFTGDGSTTAFTLSINAVNENNTQVFIDGVYQQKDGYTVSNTTLTFSAAPPTSSTIEVMTFTQTEVNVPVNGTIEPSHIKAGDFYFDTNTLYIDATNNRVGIGTSSPATSLHVNSGANGEILRIQGADAQLRINNSTANVMDINSSGSGDSLTLSTNDTERMRIDASGNVGIGVDTSLSNKLTIEAASQHLRLQGTSNNNKNVSIQYNESGDYGQINCDESGVNQQDLWITGLNLKFGRNTSTATMTLDTSGNLLVGTTDINPSQNAVEGIALSAGSYGGYFSAARSGGVVAQLARLTNDGDILNFRNSTDSIGSIVTSGGDLAIGTGNTKLRFNDASDAIYSGGGDGSGTNAGTDLGTSDYKFGDLYLSGGVVFPDAGSTGTATNNKLDSYEEGTWTPSYSAGTGVASHSVQTGLYTKIGNKVTVIAELQADRNTLSGTIKISGLPFSASGNGGGFYPTFAMRFNSDMPNLKGYAAGGEINLRKQATNATSSTVLTETDLSNAGTAYNYIYFTATYFTTA